VDEKNVLCVTRRTELPSWASRLAAMNWRCASKAGRSLPKSWATLKQNVIDRLAEIVRSARRGDFPVHSQDPQCTRTCDFRTVCRVAQVRSLEKVWTPEDT
jgi:hypothetical protein